jgi:hypothetical protein
MRFASLVVLSLLGCGGDRPPRMMEDAGPPPPPIPCEGCEATAMGDPLWQPVDMLITSGLIGFNGAKESPFAATLGQIFMPLHRVDTTSMVIAPGEAHRPPYGGELPTLVTNAGFRLAQSLDAWEVSAPGGVILAMTAVPTEAAPFGASADFTNGRIVPNTVFPIHIDGEMTRDGMAYDSAFDSDFPGPGGGGDGASHWFFVAGENESWGPPGTPVPGSYVFTLTLTDATGAGWVVRIPYTVVPPPTPGCDDMGEHFTFADALPLAPGDSIVGRVCEFGDMYRVGGGGEQTVTLLHDPAGMPLDFVVFDAAGGGMIIGRTMTADPRESVRVPTGSYIQVFGEAMAMGAYILQVR